MGNHVQKQAGPNSPFTKGIEGILYEPTKAEEEKAQRRLQDARLRLTVRLPFFGHLALRLRMFIAKPEHMVPTAAVSSDGTVHWNFKFLEALTEPELLGVLCHEVLHPALLCFARVGDRNKIVWNYAHDYSFNLDILDMAAQGAADQVALPDGCLIEEKYRGWTAESIYDDIMDQIVKNAQGKGQKGQGQSPADKSGAGEGLEDMRDDLSSTEAGQRAAKGSESHKKEIEAGWKEGVVTAAQKHEAAKRGTLPAGIQKFIEALTDPKVEWPMVLSRWMGENGPRQDYSYRRPSRRSAALDVLLPSLQRHGVDDIIVLWDSSGSQCGRECEILPEIGSICEDLGLAIRVMICDAAVHSDVRDVHSAEEAAAGYAGGGGSDFCPAFDILEHEGAKGVVLAFTDGHIGVPSIKPVSLREVLWILWDEHHDIDPTHGTWGSVLRIDKDGYARFER